MLWVMEAMGDGMRAEFQALQNSQRLQGAVFRTEDAIVDDRPIPLSFGMDAEAIAAVREGVALCDRSHWGRIEVSDSDRLRFLHNQSTNDFMAMQPGQGCETVFVTSTARTIDLVSAYVRAESVLLLTHPTCRDALLKWMDRFIFFADKVKLTDRTEETVTFSLIGPKSSDLLMTLGVEEMPDCAHHHQIVSIQEIDVTLALGSGLGLPGYTLMASGAQGEALWRLLSDGTGAIPFGETVWDYLRMVQGRPLPGAELTEDYNPLEAGLWHTISFDKGCYIGQETITRLDTYNGVKQQLWSLQLPQRVEPGTPIMLDGKKVGVLTSILAAADVVPGLEAAQPFMGLGYVKTKAGGAGLTVSVGDVVGTVADLPFLTRSRQSSDS